jgi:hypothetical protein
MAGLSSKSSLSVVLMMSWSVDDKGKKDKSKSAFE